MRKRDSEHMGRVAELPCAICGDMPVQVHHIREGQGMAQRANNYLTVPLCSSCHTGPRGVHGDKSLLRARKLGELDLLANTIEALSLASYPSSSSNAAKTYRAELNCPPTACSPWNA